jgi:flagellin-like hook-associated protein FlgL
MSNDIVLSNALRTNLLSLQGTQSNIDKVQQALSTGLKVNSALDNPQSFFAASSLKNRSNDLTRLLDGMGQSISTIQTADKGVKSLTKLVEQADSIAQQARDALSSANSEAKITGNADLRGFKQLSDIATISAGDSFDITTTDSDGNAITETITINAGDSIQGLAAEITDQFANTRNGEVIASVNGQGQLEIQSTTGNAFRIDNITLGGGTGVASVTAGLQSLGLDQFFATEADGAGNQVVAATVVPGDTLSSVALFKNATDLADASTSLSSIVNAAGANLFAGLDNAADDLRVTINDNTTRTINLTSAAGVALTVQDVVDQINNDSQLNGLIEASFDTDTGTLNIKATSAETKTVGIGLVGDDGTTRADFGFGGAALAPIGTTQNAEDRVFALGTSAGTLKNLETDYNNILTQIDQLVGDSNYRGTNLLDGNNLTTVFNEDRTSSLSVSGANFTSSGLGMEKADFTRSSTISDSINQIRSATESIRSFGSSLSNNLAIIQTRQDFTKDLVNELGQGADKLTVADPNEEGAKLLALQTRQQLAVTALSLASQSQQSVLRLF